jgi:hypothetical protein
MSERDSWTAPLEEIWEIRRRIMAQFDNDLSRYAAHLIKMEDEYRDRLISTDEKRKPDDRSTGKSAA